MIRVEMELTWGTDRRKTIADYARLVPSGIHVDHRTDIYWLGAVAYFALSGERVFDLPTTVETLSAHINLKPSPIPETHRAVPAVLKEILFRCLSKDPACRFQTAAELAAALESIES